MHRADAVGEQRDTQRLAVLSAGLALAPAGGAGALARDGRELDLLRREERCRGRVRDGGDAGVEQAVGGSGEVTVAADRADRDVDRVAEPALVRAARPAVEVGVAEVLALHVVEQRALVEVAEPDGPQPRAQQAAGVVRA